MKNEIVIGDFKFWVKKNLIYCTINKGFEENSNWNEIEEIFLYAITKLSKGKFLPILINMSLIDTSLAIKTFNFLSNNFPIKKAVLSKTFIVEKYWLKIVLSVYNLRVNTFVPNRVFKNHNLATQDSNKKYDNFYKLRLKKIDLI